MVSLLDITNVLELRRMRNLAATTPQFAIAYGQHTDFELSYECSNGYYLQTPWLITFSEASYVL